MIGVPPGSKFSVDQLAAMVIDFLGTAELPENLQSRDLTQRDRQAHRAAS